MFCKNCGQQIEDSSKVCNYCGTAVEEENAQAPVNNGFNASAPVAGKPLNKNVMMGIVAAVAVVAVIIVISLFSAVFGKSEKTPLDDAMKIVNKKPTDVDKIVDGVAPGFIADAYFDVVDVLKKNDTYKEYINDIYEESETTLEDTWEDMTDALEDELGEKVKFSYKIEKKEKIKKDDLKTVAELYQELGQFKEQMVEAVEVLAEATELEDKEVKKLVKVVEDLSDEFEKFKISKGYEIKVKVTAEGKDDDESEKFELAIVKANGEWMIDPILTFAINSDMDADDIKDLYDDEIKDSVEEFEDSFDDVIDMMEEGIKELDEDILEVYLEDILSQVE